MPYATRRAWSNLQKELSSEFGKGFLNNVPGIGVPTYYEWRTRSGCYFCFFQRKAEWVGLAERHPDLFEKAIAYEQKADRNHGSYGMRERNFTWSPGEPLPELLERREEILDKHEKAIDRAAKKRMKLPLIDVLGAALDEDDDTPACQVCSI